jgi:hypothetical protein
MQILLQVDTDSSHRVNGLMLHILSDGIPIIVILTVAAMKRSLFELHHGLLAFAAST